MSAFLVPIEEVGVSTRPLVRLAAKLALLENDQRRGRAKLNELHAEFRYFVEHPELFFSTPFDEGAS